MRKNEFVLLQKAFGLLCDIETIGLDDKNFDKWNKGTLIIYKLLEVEEKKRGFEND